MQFYLMVMCLLYFSTWTESNVRNKKRKKCNTLATIIDYGLFCRRKVETTKISSFEESVLSILSKSSDKKEKYETLPSGKFRNNEHHSQI